VIVGLSIVLLIFWQRQHNLFPPAPKAPSQTSSEHTNKQANWETFTDCTLLPAHSNDGDSFLVKHGDQSNTFRLYFVDCPEKSLSKLNTTRLEDQARYFNLPSPQAASGVGQAAAAFTLHLLERPFTVITKWERVFDSKRFYAQLLVRTDDNQTRDLSELLIEHGYARIFTKGTQLQNHVSDVNFTQHLRALESASKAAHSGAWKQ
jgi:endonuclease YncB( thermonuclease family)